MIKICTSCAAVGLALLVPLSADATRVYWAGLDDHFDNGPDTAVPSESLQARLSEYGELQDFDLVPGDTGGHGNRHVAHTFVGVPTRTVGATLEFRVRAGARQGVENDGLFLSFTDAETEDYLDSVVYRRSFGPVPVTNPSYPEPDEGIVGYWADGEEAYITLDLAALVRSDGQVLNLIPAMKEKGYLDVNISDETGVDFLRLEYRLEGKGIEHVTAAEPEILLLGNYPNPFRNSTTVRFSLRRSADAAIRVFDVSGRLVRTVHQGTLPAGEHAVNWDGRDELGRDVTAGVYLYRLEGRGFTETRRMILVQ